MDAVNQIGNAAQFCPQRRFNNAPRGNAGAQNRRMVVDAFINNPPQGDGQGAGAGFCTEIDVRIGMDDQTVSNDARTIRVPVYAYDVGDENFDPFVVVGLKVDPEKLQFRRALAPDHRDPRAEAGGAGQIFTLPPIAWSNEEGEIGIDYRRVFPDFQGVQYPAGEKVELFTLEFDVLDGVDVEETAIQVRCTPRRGNENGPQWVTQMFWCDQVRFFGLSESDCARELIPEETLNALLSDEDVSRPVRDGLIRFEEQPSFIRGDANSSGTIDVRDAVNTLEYLFLGTGGVNCEDAADVNDSGKVDISDAIYTLSHLYLNGEAPMSPYPEAGQDQSEDPLGCNQSQ